MRVYGKPDMEGASSSGATLGPDEAAMQLDQVLADGQAKPQAIDFSRQPCIHTMEALEDTLNVFGGNT